MNRITETRHYLPSAAIRHFHMDLEEANYRLLFEAIAARLSSPDAWALYDAMRLALGEPLNVQA